MLSDPPSRTITLPVGKVTVPEILMLPKHIAPKQSFRPPASEMP